MIRLALHTAFRKGFTGPEIRAAVERWLDAAPPERVLVVDPSAEMAELLVHEMRRRARRARSSCSLDELATDPGRARRAHRRPALPRRGRAHASHRVAVEVRDARGLAGRPQGHRGVPAG